MNNKYLLYSCGQIVWFDFMAHQPLKVIWYQIHFYTYILEYIQFSLVGFYSISTVVGYLMPKPLYTYVLRYMICKHIFVDEI